MCACESGGGGGEEGECVHVRVEGGGVGRRNFQADVPLRLLSGITTA